MHMHVSGICHATGGLLLLYLPIARLVRPKPPKWDHQQPGDFVQVHKNYPEHGIDYSHLRVGGHQRLADAPVSDHAAPRLLPGGVHRNSKISVSLNIFAQVHGRPGQRALPAAHCQRGAPRAAL